MKSYLLQNLREKFLQINSDTFFAKKDDCKSISCEMIIY